MEWIEDLFHVRKPIIAMCHLRALPGDPEYDPQAGLAAVVAQARADLRDRAKGLDLGGLDYITKPFNPVELATLVRDVVAAVQRGEREELRAEKLAELRELLGSA
jgi:predicted TIM-barrel enzyme